MVGEALLESHEKDRKLRKQYLKVLDILDVPLLPQGSCGTLHLSKIKSMNAGRQIYQIKRENILKSLQVVWAGCMTWEVSHQKYSSS